MTILITGSTGLIGSNTALFFLKKKYNVVGVDNDMRKNLFGKEASTKQQLNILRKYPNYIHYNKDIRDEEAISQIFNKHHFDTIIHCAGQPSHDKGKEIPLIDFDINTRGTLVLLEATRHHSPKATFIYTSTNKVYGDHPNKIQLIETPTRYYYKDKNFKGFNETTSIDNAIHSYMGSSKLAADIYVQEYGKNLGLKTTCLRLGCVTGPFHAGTKAHGFLSYLTKSLIKKNKYEIIGYKGKQIRDQIHVDDVTSAMNEIIKLPKSGEIYNLGGGMQNHASILELIDIIKNKLKIEPIITYQKKHRTGDHICYITDFSKFQKHYPKWKLKYSLSKIINQIINFEQARKQQHEN